MTSTKNTQKAELSQSYHFRLLRDTIDKLVKCNLRLVFFSSCPLVAWNCCFCFDSKSPGVCSPLHNVLFVQYVFLPTEQAETFPKMYVLIYHLTYICSSLFGWKENMIFEETVTRQLVFVYTLTTICCIGNHFIALKSKPPFGTCRL